MPQLAKFSSFAILLLFLSIVSWVAAHSPAWPTIAYSETVQLLRHDILQRKHHSLSEQRREQVLSKRSSNTLIVQRGDLVRVQLSVFNKTFFLHLEPNFDLIHPALASSGQEDLGSLDDIKPFKGVVLLDSELSKLRWDRALTTTRAGTPTVEHMLYEDGVVGWARMMIEQDDTDKSMVLRGAYTADGETYHVTSRQHYSIQKRVDDHLPLSAASDVVIYRDSDLLHPRQFNKRGDYAQILSCGTAKSHNNASGNASTSHGYYYPPPLISQVSPAAGVGWSRIGSVFHFDSLKKRDDPVMIKIAGPNPIPSGCPTDRVVNFIGVAADCTYVRAYGGLEGARKQIFADFNTASGIYESTFNVALGIVSMQIQSMNCPSTPVKGVLWNQECSVDYTINDRLSDFSFWRGQSNRTQDGAGLWHLLTNCKSGSIVGLAWTKSLCEMDAQAQGPANATEYTSGTGVSSVSPNEWMVVAHEIGHGFGASHDCTSSTCVSAQAISDAACCPLSSTTCDGADNYIMNPEEQAPRTSFSPCSINAICSTIASQGQCLQPPTAREIQQTAVNVCGNGIVEEGEQCDCGSPDECAKDPCCDGSTCKFKGSAVCDDRQDDCCRNCQFAPLGQVCRSALSDCDIAETCNGTSAICPPDDLVADLTPCQIIGAQNKTLSQGQCASGYCTSRDYQCAQLQRPGITRQCPSSTTGCELLCNDPSGAVNMCVKIPGAYFQNGSPCGSSGAGTCSGARCNMPRNWAQNHLQILLPVTIVPVFLIVTGIGLWVFCLRRKNKRATTANELGVYPPHNKDHRINGNDASISKIIIPSDDAKDSGVMTEVPRWMMSSNRRSTSGVLSRRGSQVVISRRTSLSVQNMFQTDQGDQARPPPPPVVSEQRSPQGYDVTAFEGYPGSQRHEDCYPQQNSIYPSAVDSQSGYDPQETRHGL